MAKVILDKGDVYVAASTVTILGNTGSETVKIQDGVSVTVDSSVERIEFSRASLAYTYKTTSTGMQVLYNNSIVANVVGGQKLSFTDGSASVVLGTFDPVKLSVPITLGGVAVSSTASSITPTLNTAASEISTLTPIPTIPITTTPTFSVLPVGTTVAGTSTSVLATVVAESFSLNVAAAKASAPNTQDVITGFNVTNDALSLSGTGIAPGTKYTLASVLSGVGVTYDPFAGQTVVNFGLDANGDLISLSLVGVATASTVNVTIIS